MAEPKNEKDVKARIKKLLDAHNYYWFMPPANGYGKGGISDILAIKNGVFLAIEAKFGYNKPSALQIGFLNSIRAEKGFAFVVNEKNLNWLEAWLKAFDNATLGVAAYEGAEKEKGVDPADGATMLDAIRALTELI